MAVVKDDRLQLRIDPAAKRVIEEAADAAHLSVSAFVIQAAQRQAEAIVAERETIRLAPDAAAAFADALSRPGRVNPRLADALARPRKLSWLD
jgi:uncharacterized protein (DUF1778 family)